MEKEDKDRSWLCEPSPVTFPQKEFHPADLPNQTYVWSY